MKNSGTDKPVFSVVVPAYNEEEVIAQACARLTAVMEQTGEEFEIIFVNDGSRDSTADIIRDIAARDRRVKLINFSRNFGHQSAVTAGIDRASGDAVVIIDADLQDPPEVIPLMIEKWREGFNVVYGKRVKRRGEGVFKKITAKLYYRVLRRLTDVDIPTDTGDFRLIDGKVCAALKKLNEKNRYMRGLVSWVGFKQTSVEYEREKRAAGKTKYPVSKMFSLAADGITSFSYKPLRIAASAGLLVSAAGFVYLLVIIYQKLFTDTTVTGWASTLAVILFTQGFILTVLGIMGEYIGRIYAEIKNRPIYLTDDCIGFDDEPPLGGGE